MKNDAGEMSMSDDSKQKAWLVDSAPGTGNVFQCQEPCPCW